MISEANRTVQRWLFAFCGVVAVLIVFGGYVRLTRSGLSIVEWDPVTGVLPPIGAGAWRRAFAEYQRSPEFIKVNSTMTLGEFQRIFTIEWVHRLGARLAGFSYAVPFFVFVARKRIPRRDLGVYLVMGSLFVFQAIAGWVMVASGLKDRPSVSHFNLTVHLLLAFTLLALALWTALDHGRGPMGGQGRSKRSRASVVATMFLGVLGIQIAYGGFTAGLKAGHVSDTWPKMFGVLVPGGLFDSFTDLFEEPATIVFIHRWFAFAVAAMAVLVVVACRGREDLGVRRAVRWILVVVCLQIVLGVVTVLSSVQMVVALAHQATAIALFGASVYLLHSLRSLDAAKGPNWANEAT